MSRILKIFFFPQKGIGKFSPFFRYSIFAANNIRKYYFNMVSLMRTSFITMQYSVLERERERARERERDMFTFLSFLSL